jgi:hypothetical protein
MDKRCEHAFTVLATMALVSGAICICGTALPEHLLLSAAIVAGMAGLGVLGINLIWLFITLEQFNNI